MGEWFVCKYFYLLAGPLLFDEISKNSAQAVFPNIGSSQIGIQTYNVWFAHFVETGLSGNEILACYITETIRRYYRGALGSNVWFLGLRIRDKPTIGVVLQGRYRL